MVKDEQARNSIDSLNIDIESLSNELNQVKKDVSTAKTNGETNTTSINAINKTLSDINTLVNEFNDDMKNISKDIKSYTGDKLITPYMFGAVGDGITDDSQAFIDAVEHAKELITSEALIDEGVTVYIPAGRYLITRPIVIDKSGISIKGEGYSSTVIIARDYNEYIFRIESSDDSALWKNEISDLTIYTPKNDGNTPSHIHTYKMYYGTLRNLRLISYYNGIEIRTGGKTTVDNVMMFQANANETSNHGLVLDGSDLHVSNVNIVPNIDNCNIALECKNIDGAYISNLHTNALCRITAVNWDGSGGTANNIKFVNCFFDTSMKDCVHINGHSDNSIRNIMFTNCTFFNNANSSMIFNTAYRTGPVMISDSVLGNCYRAIMGNVKTLLNVSNCTFWNVAQENIVLTSSDNIITGCRFINENSKNYAVKCDSKTDNIISLCNFKDFITTLSSKLNVCEGNICVNNIE